MDGTNGMHTTFQQFVSRLAEILFMFPYIAIWCKFHALHNREISGYCTFIKVLISSFSSHNSSRSTSKEASKNI